MLSNLFSEEMKRSFTQAWWKIIILIASTHRLIYIPIGPIRIGSVLWVNQVRVCDGIDNIHFIYKLGASQLNKLTLLVWHHHFAHLLSCMAAVIINISHHQCRRKVNYAIWELFKPLIRRMAALLKLWGTVVEKATINCYREVARRGERNETWHWAVSLYKWAATLSMLKSKLASSEGRENIGVRVAPLLSYLWPVRMTSCRYIFLIMSMRGESRGGRYFAGEGGGGEGRWLKENRSDG